VTYEGFHSLYAPPWVVSKGFERWGNFGQACRVKETLYVVCATRKMGNTAA